jgi:peptidoglycan/xylan/chitin deacetylase (PgdA/CDA1 family)
MEITSQKGAPPVRAACLLYHDVVGGTDWESSGFSGPGTARYKLSRAEFDSHLAAIARVRNTSAITAHELASASAGTLPFLLTFDDGGESAFTQIAGMLEKHSWRGHFFITTGQISRKGFLNPEQIRLLRKQGHVIGSHSFSHPTRMSHCTPEELTTEWTTSIQALSDILGEKVDTASVPGGYYSRKVGETAAAAGVRVLFNSEPTTRIEIVAGCFIVGRFNVFRATSPNVSADLVAFRSTCRSRQWFYWNTKKIAKTLAGKPYLATRQWLLRKG